MQIKHQGRVIVVGGGGLAREIAWLARECVGGADLVGFLDDAPDLHGESICGVPVLGTVDEWPRYADCSFVVAIGAPRVRRNVVSRMEAVANRPRFATLVHASVSRSAYVTIGEGSMITAGCVLTTQIELGRHVILNLSSTVGHDTHLHDYVNVAPMVAISGNVTAEAGAELGTASSIRQGITIGRGAVIGMGSAVIKDVEANTVVVGAPAKPLRTLDAF